MMRFLRPIVLLVVFALVVATHPAAAQCSGCTTVSATACAGSCPTLSLPHHVEVLPGAKYSVPVTVSGPACYVVPNSGNEYDAPPYEDVEDFGYSAYSVGTINGMEVCYLTSRATYVVVRFPMKADFAWGSPPAYLDAFAGEPTGFRDFSLGLPDNFTYHFGDGATSNFKHPAHTYQDGGFDQATKLCMTFPVTLDVRSDTWGGSASVTIPVEVRRFADFVYSPDAPVTGDTIQLLDTSARYVEHQPSLYTWDFGDGRSSNLANPTVSYALPGTYTVSLTVARQGKSETKTRQITVGGPAAPVANFTVSPNEPAAGEEAQFTDTSTGTPNAWLWTFSPGQTSTSPNPKHTFPTPGTYLVTLKATNLGGDGTVTKPVTVTGSPAADFDWSPAIGEPGRAMQFFDRSTPGVADWFWQFGDGGTSTSQSPTYTYTQPGDYLVSLRVTYPGGLIKTMGKGVPVQLQSTPLANFTFSPPGPQVNEPVRFTDASTGSPGITQWFWSFGDGATSTSQSPSHAYGTAGAFDATLTVTNSVGSDSITRRVLVAVGPERAPTADFTFSPAGGGITGEPVQFTDLSTDAPADWLWEFGDGSTSIARNPSHVFAGPGTYLVKLTVTNSKGSNSKQIPVTVTARSGAPRAAFTYSPPSPLVGQTVAFTDTSTDAPTEWLWAFGDGGSANGRQVTHAFASPGFHTVTLTARNASGENAVSRSVSVSQGTLSPDFSISPRQARIGETVTFTDLTTGGPDQWQWAFGDGQLSTSRNPSHAYTRAGLFTVALTVSKGSERQVAEHTVAVIDKVPLARFSYSPLAPRAGDAITFKDESENEPTDRYWEIDGVLVSRAKTFSYTARTAGGIDVHLRVENAAGRDDATRRVSIQALPEAPKINVTSQYGRCFFDGAAITNRLDATVDWKGLPGTLTFNLDGGPARNLTVTNGLASVSLLTGSELQVRRNGTISVASFLAKNQMQEEGRAAFPLYSFPVPPYMGSIVGQNAYSYDTLARRVGIGYRLALPAVPLEGAVTFPSIIPYLGGKEFGLKKIQAIYDTVVRTDCTSQTGLSGTVGVKLGTITVAGTLRGGMEQTITPASGFVLRSWTFGASLLGAASVEQSLVDAIPLLGGVCSNTLFQGVCGLAKIKTETSVQGGFDLKANLLGFESASFPLRLGLKATLDIDAAGFRWYSTGGGSINFVFATDGPAFLRRVEAGVEVTMSISIWGMPMLAQTISASCGLEIPAGLRCSNISPFELGPAQRAIPLEIRVRNEAGPFGETVFLSDVPAGAMPRVASLGSGRLVVFEREKGGLDPLHKTDLVSTLVRDGASGEPVSVLSDERGDFHPSVAALGATRAVAVWERNRNAALKGSELAGDLTKLVREMEIVASTFDLSTGRWSEPVALTDNTVVDHAPRVVSIAEGRAVAVWARNEGNLLAGTAASPSRLVARELVNGTWGAEQIVVSGLTGELSFDVAAAPAEVFVAYSQAGDIARVSLRNGAWGTPVEVTRDAAADRLPRVAVTPEGAARVFWNRDGALVWQAPSGAIEVIETIEAETGSMGLLDPSVAVSQGGRVAVSWVSAVENGPDVVTRIWEPSAGVWSKPIRVSRSPALESAVVSSFGEDGALDLVCLQTELHSTSRDRVFDGQTVTITGISERGRVDLVNIRKVLVSDAAVDGPLTASASEPSITGTVRNAGELPLRDVPVALLAGKGATGERLASGTVAGLLLPGETRVVSLPYARPEGTRAVTFVVDPEARTGDVDLANNTASLTFENRLPLPCMQASAAYGEAPLSVSFDAGCSTDVDGRVARTTYVFGDGTALESPTAMHVFDTPGTYTVSLSVVDDEGAAASVTREINVVAPGASPTQSLLTRESRSRLYLPVVAKARGQAGTNYVSDVTLFNPDLAETLVVDALYLPDGRADVFPMRVLVPPGELLALQDVVAQGFGAPSGSGWVRLDLSRGDAQAASRTYNDQPAGTAGVFVASAREADALVPGQTRIFPSHHRNGYRVNLGFTEISGHDTVVTAVAYDANGVEVGRKTYDLGPFQHAQDNGDPLFQRAGRVAVSVSTGKVLPYATTVDNQTGDGVFQTGQTAETSGAARTMIPSVARVAGLNDTLWRTDLRLHNPAPTAQRATLLFVMGDGQMSASRDLAPGETLAFDDAVTALFPSLEGGVSGVLHASAAGPLVATARTYNLGTGGTYGVSLPVRSSGSLLSAGDLAQIIQLQSDASYRCNLGLATSSAVGGTVRVRAFDDRGAQLGEKDYAFGPMRGAQVTRVFEDLGATGPLTAARLEILVLDGSEVSVYATVVDNRTGDGVLVEAAR